MKTRGDEKKEPCGGFPLFRHALSGVGSNGEHRFTVSRSRHQRGQVDGGAGCPWEGAPRRSEPRQDRHYAGWHEHGNATDMATARGRASDRHTFLEEGRDNSVPRGDAALSSANAQHRCFRIAHRRQTKGDSNTGSQQKGTREGAVPDSECRNPTGILSPTNPAIA